MSILDFFKTLVHFKDEEFEDLPDLPADFRLSTPITVSLTSTSERIERVHQTVESLLNQELKADKVVLWLSQEPYLIDKGINPEDLNASLCSLLDHGLEIRWTKNTGPYRKAIPILRESDADGGVLVTADDDIVYPSDWLKNLIKYHLAYPGAIICYRGFYMKGFSEGKLTPYMRWKRHKGKEPSLSVFPTGKDGVLYPANSLNQEVFNESKYLALAPTADDVWLKAMSLLNHTRVKNITSHNKKDFPIIEGSNNKTLFQKNRKGNDGILAAVFEEYKLV